MAGIKFTGWDDQGSKPKGQTFLKLTAGQEYRLRLIGNPTPVLLVYLENKLTGSKMVYRSPYMDEAGKIIDPLLLAGVITQDDLKEKWSCWVIDRTDGKFKITDVGWGLKNKFGMWKKNFNDEPGGPKGPDWAISSTGTFKNTKWEAMPLDRTPWTDEEVKFMKENNLKKLIEEVRRPDTPDEIRARYERFRSDPKSLTQPAVATPAPVPLPPAAPVQVIPTVSVTTVPVATTVPAAQVPAPAATVAPAAPTATSTDFQW